MNKEPPIVFRYSGLRILVYSVNAFVKSAAKYTDRSLKPKVYLVLLIQEVDEESLHNAVNSKSVQAILSHVDTASASSARRGSFSRFVSLDKRK